MPFLKGPDLADPALQRDDRVASRGGSRQRGRIRNPVLQRRCPDLVVVLLGQLAQWSVDQELDLSREEQVDGVGATFVHLEHPFRRNAAHPEMTRRAFCRQNPEAHFVEAASDGHDVALVVVIHRDEDRATLRERAVRRMLCLREGHTEGIGDAHDLAGRAHLGSQDQVNALQLVEGEDRFLDRDVRLNHVVLEAQLVEGLPHHDRGGKAGE